MLRNSLRRLSSVVTLRARPPPNTAVTSACFTITNDAPPSPLEPHQLRCTTLLLSVDPFLRCRFNADPGVAYTSAYEIDAPIASAGLGYVTESNADGFQPGDLVLEPFDAWPWADEVVLDASRVARVPRAHRMEPSEHCSPGPAACAARLTRSVTVVTHPLWISIASGTYAAVIASVSCCVTVSMQHLQQV